MSASFTSVVREVVRETPDIVTLKLSAPDGGRPDFIPGQYIAVYFPDLGTPEGKVYSISSAPHQPWLAITVKRVGAYSSRLHSLRPGDTLQTSAPFGYFCPEPEKPLVMLAGGIGVAPFWSIIQHDAYIDAKRPIQLWHSSRTLADRVFHEQLAQAAKTHPVFTLCEHITREHIKPTELLRSGRINPAAVISPGEQPMYMICGTVPFAKTMWQGLVQADVPEADIMTETFFGT